jgi:hypothetical protein
MYDIDVVTLPNSTDSRGRSYSLPSAVLALIKGVEDMHIASIERGCVRGNHYHVRKGELITVIYDGAWSLHWDNGEGTPAKSRRFDGVGAVSFAPPSKWSHAVRNDDAAFLWIIASSDQPYDTEAVDEVGRDAIARTVTD